MFYNLTPYIFTLAKGGWFNWVIRKKDVMYRKPIKKSDFFKKEVNRLYPNEVLVRCPNPYNAVVAGVGLWPQDKINIRILHCDGNCLAAHQPDDKFIIAKNEFLEKSLNFNRLFPKILSLSLTGQLPERNENFCKEDNEITVEVSKIIFPCHYHKKKKEFKPDFLPGGFSPHIFIMFYPYILAAMYNATIDKKLSIQDNGKYLSLILDKIYLKRNALAKAARNLLKKLFEAVFYPVDILDYDIEINILESESTESSLKKGKKYMVNLRNQNFLCPASFHVLYPYLLLAASGYKMKWDGHNTTSLLPCPDCVGTVYSINE